MQWVCIVKTPHPGCEQGLSGLLGIKKNPPTYEADGLTPVTGEEESLELNR